MESEGGAARGLAPGIKPTVKTPPGVEWLGSVVSRAPGGWGAGCCPRGPAEGHARRWRRVEGRKRIVRGTGEGVVGPTPPPPPSAAPAAGRHLCVCGS